MRRPTIDVFTLGGTIASVPDATGRRATPSLSAQDLVDSVPGLAGVADLRVTTFRQLPSGDLALSDIHALAAAIRSAVGQGSDGVVVTQGTDTLEESAFLLDLLLPAAIPVVVTGAMRNAGLPGADGPANLLASVQVAASERARDLGTVVVFNDEIHAARYVRKTHTSSTGAFRSPTVGPIGWVSEGRVRIPLAPRRPQRRFDLPDEVVFPEIALLHLSLGTSDRLIRSLAAQDAADGAVIEVFGGGHASAGTVDALEELSRSMPVVFASRTGAGELLESTYGFVGSEQDLLRRGLISAGVMDGLKARLLLTLLVAEGASRSDMVEAFSALP